MKYNHKHYAVTPVHSHSELSIVLCHAEHKKNGDEKRFKIFQVWFIKINEHTEIELNDTKTNHEADKARYSYEWIKILFAMYFWLLRYTCMRSTNFIQ